MTLNLDPDGRAPQPLPCQRLLSGLFVPFVPTAVRSCPGVPCQPGGFPLALGGHRSPVQALWRLQDQTLVPVPSSPRGPGAAPALYSRGHGQCCHARAPMPGHPLLPTAAPGRIARPSQGLMTDWFKRLLAGNCSSQACVGSPPTSTGSPSATLLPPYRSQPGALVHGEVSVLILLIG